MLIIRLIIVCVCVQAQQCVLLKAQLQECEERTAWMNAHTHQLQLQLQHTQQGLRDTLAPSIKLNLSASFLSMLSDSFAS